MPHATSIGFACGFYYANFDVGHDGVDDGWMESATWPLILCILVDDSLVLLDDG